MCSPDVNEMLGIKKSRVGLSKSTTLLFGKAIV